MPTNEDERREIFPIDSRQHFERLDVIEGCFLLCPSWWSVCELRYSYHRMYYVYGGAAWYIEGNRRVDLKKGWLYVFPSQSKRYAIFQDPEQPLQVLWCHFEMTPDMVNDLIEFDPSREPEFLELLNVWRHVVDLPQPGNEINCIVKLILCMLERVVPFSYVRSPFEDIERYITEHLADGVSVETLAAHAGYERAYFTRKFKSMFQLSPGEYLRTVRMSKATSMLKSGMSIDNVCQQLGYTDKKVFARAFKTYVGLTPYAYQKSHKMQPW